MSVLVGTSDDIKENKQDPVAFEGKTSLYHKLSTSVVWAKLTRWEFWPFSVFYFPVVFYWMWISLRARSFFFFTASNPGIEFGGMLGESKDKIYKEMDPVTIPKTFKLTPGLKVEYVASILQEEKISYPFILKPDIGERGWMVELIKNEDDLSHYLDQIKVDFLVQEYVPYPIELGVFYYRYPDRDRGTVSSIVMKEMLSVSGDGHSTVQELALRDVRAKMHLETLQDTKPEVLSYIPHFNEKVELVSIGNHCRGTTFLNGNHLINEKLIKLLDNISADIKGFYFGRFDLRCATMEDLYEGKNFKILELNGAGSEPAHIYHPGFSLLQAYKDIIHHLRVLADISIMNHRRGVPYMTFREGIREVLRIRKYNKDKEKAA